MSIIKHVKLNIIVVSMYIFRAAAEASKAAGFLLKTEMQNQASYESSEELRIKNK